MVTRQHPWISQKQGLGPWYQEDSPISDQVSVVNTCENNSLKVNKFKMDMIYCVQTVHLVHQNVICIFIVYTCKHINIPTQLPPMFSLHDPKITNFQKSSSRALDFS